MTIGRTVRNRGSVILMVVGLLTVISLLGITYLVVSRFDANQAKKIASRRAIIPVSEGILDEIVRAVKSDLHFNASSALGPYSGLSSGQNGWIQFVDFPSEDSDKFLASDYLYKYTRTDTPLGSQTGWQHISNIYGAADNNATHISTSNTNLRNADGDGVNDSYLFYTGTMNTEGDKVYAAVRILDTSAWINVNTAARCDSGNLTTPVCPVNVNLRDFIGSALYDGATKLHGVRCGGTQQTTATYNTECALRLFSPVARTPAYAPYGICDEAYLHWLKSKASTAIGRLHDAIDSSSSLSYLIRQMLTTHSVSRAIVRHPAAGAWPKDAFATLTRLDVSSDTNRQAVYKQMFIMLSELYSGVAESVRKQMAANFTANLWAYQDSINNLDSTTYWAFTPKNGAGADESITAYGLVPDLVISEGYAAHYGESVPGSSDDHKFASAIEILNVSGRSIDLSKYEIQGLADGSLSGTLGNNDRVVVYSYGKGGGGSVAPGDFGFPADGTAKWIKKTDLSFIDNKTYTLVRKIGSELIPIDSVSSSDIGYNYNMSDVKNDKSSITSFDSLRDDDTTRCRYNVAAYADPVKTGHNLGQANNLNATQLSQVANNGAKYGVKIIQQGSAISSIGDCFSVYLAGPLKVGGNLTPFTKRLRDSTFLTVFPDDTARGRLNLHPDSVPSGGFNGSEYPDVPAAAFLGEFFTSVPPDSTRLDNATRFYGKLNINTAGGYYNSSVMYYVLQRLPFPTSTFSIAGSTVTFDAATAAKFILAYRNGDTVTGPSGKVWNYAAPSAAAGANIANLRSVDVTKTTGDGRHGFLAVGEVAIPLADYANDLMKSVTGKTPEELAAADGNYSYVRDAMYRAISNCITVNSDTFVATIRIQLGNGDPTSGIWYYIAVIDRSNCMTKDDSPAVLLFNEISK